MREGEREEERMRKKERRREKRGRKRSLHKHSPTILCNPALRAETETEEGMCVCCALRADLRLYTQPLLLPVKLLQEPLHDHGTQEFDHLKVIR